MDPYSLKLTDQVFDKIIQNNITDDNTLFLMNKIKDKLSIKINSSPRTSISNNINEFLLNNQSLIIERLPEILDSKDICQDKKKKIIDNSKFLISSLDQKII